MANGLDAIRHSISVTLAEIQAAQRSIGINANDPSDREAYDIVCRIERKLMASSAKKDIDMNILPSDP